jgi:ABC-type dipeptide/oligopeptide/nickel transport system ATPase component
MNIVEIKNLSITFKQHGNTVNAVRNISLELKEGESLGIVGESGSGKSVTFMSLLGLINSPTAIIKADKLEIGGIDLLINQKKNLSKIRGKIASMVFQDSMTSFDPLFTIGYQIIETILTHKNINKNEAFDESIKLLKKVEIQNPEKVINYYPHQLSGGMLQRAMIAMALSCEPRLLIADEPTTALDVTVQAQILQLIKDLQMENNMSLIMITHDLGVIAETVDRVIVMYGGQIMENSNVVEIFDKPNHPYTKALIDSIPGQIPGKRKLKEITQDERDSWYASY